MNDFERMVREFHEFFFLPIRNEPTHPDVTERELGARLLVEEIKEYVDAEHEDDLVGVADALADIIYIAIGTAVAYGIPITKVFHEVHRSNMTKADDKGLPIFREDGKVMKGPNYEPPNIEEILFG